MKLNYLILIDYSKFFFKVLKTPFVRSKITSKLIIFLNLDYSFPKTACKL